MKKKIATVYMFIKSLVIGIVSLILFGLVTIINIPLVKFENWLEDAENLKDHWK